MRTLSFAFACLSFLGANGADAQVHYGPHAPCPGYPVATIYIGGPHHASTAVESYARGRADLIRAQGQYDLLTSQAMLYLVEAYRRATEYRVARTEAYFRMREINWSHRHGGRRAPSSGHSITSHHRTAPNDSESKPESLDLREGRIAWPEALSDDAFQSYRAVVERVVQRQAPSWRSRKAD